MSTVSHSWHPGKLSGCCHRPQLSQSECAWRIQIMEINKHEHVLERNNPVLLEMTCIYSSFVLHDAKLLACAEDVGKCLGWMMDVQSSWLWHLRPALTSWVLCVVRISQQKHSVMLQVTVDSSILNLNHELTLTVLWVSPTHIHKNVFYEWILFCKNGYRKENN